MLEFFSAQINSDKTRKVYLSVMRRVEEWCNKHGIGQLADMKAFQVAAFVKELQGATPERSNCRISHLRIYYSTRYWRLWPSDSDMSLMPEVCVDKSWNDCIHGKDPAWTPLRKGETRLRGLSPSLAMLCSPLPDRMRENIVVTLGA